MMFARCLWNYFIIKRAALLLLLAPAKAFAPARSGYRRPTSLAAFSVVAPENDIEVHYVADDESDNPVLAVYRLTEEAIRHRGQPKGFAALNQLGEMCAQRTAYNFDQELNVKAQSIVQLQKNLLPEFITTAFLDQVRDMERHGWLSTNPDSVDGLPSLHLNLVSGGKPIAQSDQEDSLDSFDEGLNKLLSLVRPYLYNELLPNVQKAMKDPSIAISDVFVRRYGQDIVKKGTSRNGISAHYDVFSKVTAVIAMDDTGAEGTNGLYTTALSTADGSTSNHASLRRYFPLHEGDGVVHTWDVLHGVDIEPTLDRTSLIVWFATEDVLNSSRKSRSPWLISHPSLKTDSIAQFVLASAKVSGDESMSQTPVEGAMFHEYSTGVNPLAGTSELHAHDLYLQSASIGNAFALTELASLSKGRELSMERAKHALAILEQLRPDREVRLLLGDQGLSDDETISLDALANRFWLEGALRGNPMAQLNLGDDIMEQAALAGNHDLHVLAAVLFGLAAQQGNEAATDSLVRCIDFEVAHSSIRTQEEFETSLVVQTAQAALS